MRYIIFLFSLLILCTAYNYGNVEKVSVDGLEKLFRQNLPSDIGIIYTKVPRGLIISINEDVFFNSCNSCIKESSLYVLDKFCDVIKLLPNNFVIEDHVQSENCELSLSNWELSMIRASNIAEYFVKYKKLSSDRIFDIGFGNSMPFYDNVAPKNTNGKPTGYAVPMNSRVDFVIIEYEAKR